MERETSHLSGIFATAHNMSMCLEYNDVVSFPLVSGWIPQSLTAMKQRTKILMRETMFDYTYEGLELVAGDCMEAARNSSNGR